MRYCFDPDAAFPSLAEDVRGVGLGLIRMSVGAIMLSGAVVFCAVKLARAEETSRGVVERGLFREAEISPCGGNRTGERESDSGIDTRRSRSL